MGPRDTKNNLRYLDLCGVWRRFQRPTAASWVFLAVASSTKPAALFRKYTGPISCSEKLAHAKTHTWLSKSTQTRSFAGLPSVGHGFMIPLAHVNDINAHKER